MIRFKTGNLLSDTSEALVNTVNCVGVMGKGIALEFKKAYPMNFHDYRDACERGEITPGRMRVFETFELVNPRYIVNFPTKRHWRDPSRIGDINEGLSDLARIIDERRIQSIALPALGCGLGGLNWLDVRPLIENALDRYVDVAIFVYEPSTFEIADAGSGRQIAH